MNVLVTGANGLLGHHVVMELLKNQHVVHILVRSKQKIYFDLNSITLFEGDFTDTECLTRAAVGCEAIIHIAAVTDTRLLHADDYRTVNVKGVAQIIQVANKSDIRKIVYISSANTVGYGTEQQLADERFTIQYPFTESFYAQSKSEAEKIVIEASQKPEQHNVIINPTFMLGAYDTKPGSGKLLLIGYKQKVLFIPKGGKNFVDVRKVAIAACNALTLGRNGERYLASGINLSFKEYYTLQKQVGNYSQKIFVLPDFLLVLIGVTGDVLRKAGIKTEVCSMNLRQLMIHEYYSNKKAKTELNLPDTNLKVVIKETIDWFTMMKYIK